MVAQGMKPVKADLAAGFVTVPLVTDDGTAERPAAPWSSCGLPCSLWGELSGAGLAGTCGHIDSNRIATGRPADREGDRRGTAAVRGAVVFVIGGLVVLDGCH